MRQSILEQILDLARWAPSGDNTQPWRFEILDSTHLIVHGFDTRDDCVYDLQGHASQLSLGALLETMAVAASTFGWSMESERDAGSPEHMPRIDVRFTPEPTLPADPLARFITKRSTQRRPMKPRRLIMKHRARLQAALPRNYSLVLLGSATEKARVAQLLFVNSSIRLTIPQAYAVHRRVIEWGSRTSHDRIPDQAVGLNPLSLPLMRWTMKKWKRVEFMNRYLGGTLLPRLELDVIPALLCSAHFAILAATPPVTINDHIAAGRAMQRLWLTATSLGLQIQPEMTPLIFADYARSKLDFCEDPIALNKAADVDTLLARVFGDGTRNRMVFMGRIGHGAPIRARSLRMPLEKLIHKGESTQSNSRRRQDQNI